MLLMFCTLPGVEFAACTHPFGSAHKLDEHYCVKTMDNCLYDSIKYGDGDRLCTALKLMWPILNLRNYYEYAMQFLA